jgi:hypothetical protein
MVYTKDNRIYVKKTTSNKPIFLKLNKQAGMHRLVKGGRSYVGVRDYPFPKLPKVPKEILDKIGLVGSGSKKASSKDIISEIDKALNNWSVSNAPKKPIKGGVLNFLGDLF